MRSRVARPAGVIRRKMSGRSDAIRSRAMPIRAPSDEPLPPYLPLLDPDHFRDPEFFRGLEQIGYRTVLLGGTGGARMAAAVEQVRKATQLRIVMHPSSPGEVWPVDLVLLPAVMNSNSHFTRPFGSGAVACAAAVAEQDIPYLPLAYFVLGDSTAGWYADAFKVRSKKIILAYCTYARMNGYRWIFLDYEDPSLSIEPALIRMIREHTDVRLMVSDEFTPASARSARAMGIDTIVTPSNLYEQAADPLALAREFYAALLAGRT